ncbi:MULTISPECIES: 8-amino-7-oxononanoate synthase [unclassified Paenibacillus]|uniref:8-amino-7-oxononanoate synthase n=1 Tax=unclassified Paenibacillus TaxID=185978 RepID=UPI001B606CAC|nr:MULTISPECIES: 8-amino-7-oxononanoate synthase [unclassified Paenibacillus]MBP1157516.1 8-amino-7-oxononanoate synthase [Paenibacillus sp. PvP091]MBP1171747.1 8-amino-7-oxononanoate synthase [Paenibacillus sp. PvR098]MBP2438128.1 8-amino-7-oxononanoate synthase [Paenibacillus sp. PvP052]
MRKSAWQWMHTELESLKERAQFRSLVESELQEQGWLLRDGQRMLNLASNDYLGLQQRSGIADARMGATASRLIVGNDPVYRQFEEEFARFKGTESCLLFSSGYMANVGAIPALIGRHDIVFSDRLNHASIVDGIVLSRAEHLRYRHRDLRHLESLLCKADPGSKKLIVTDSIFSMDGSIAPLEELVELKDRYGAMLMVDEAHSGGLYGEQGQGLVHELGLTERVEIQMGTFSKAYGGYGAYIAGDEVLKQYLVNKARSLIYTTALPPAVIDSVRRSWLQVREEDWRRKELSRKSAWFRDALQRRGFDTGESECHIIPLLLGSNEQTVHFSEKLQQAGIAAVAIRPPTVPEGTGRIRFTLMATHRDEDLQWAVEEIDRAGRDLG